MDDTLLKIYVPIVLTLGGAGFTLICYLLSRSVKRLDSDMEAHDKKLQKHEELHQKCEAELAKYKLEVAKEYADKVSINAAFARVYEIMESNFKEIKEDIKVIAGRK